ncbi:MAG: alcohol dehydrogenase [Myxococcales bacterium]|nr:alcohol dehydrogenase [Myxococcales bacterium]
MTRAAVMYDFMTPLEVVEVELREPAPDEVVVRMAASGMCRTDLSVIQCKLPYPPPVVLGHEGAGVVESVGSGVRHLKPGDRVVLSGITHCGRCRYCLDATPHLCPTGVQAAIDGQDYVFRRNGEDIARFVGLGTFAERTVVRASQAIQITDDIPLDRACLIGCAVITGVGAVFNTARLRPGETAAVFGCGGVGLNLIQGALIAGASQVIAVDTDPAKLEVATRFGATATVQPTNEDDAPEAIQALTGGLGVDYAFEAVGQAGVIRQAFMAVKRGGRAVVVGVPGFGVDVELPACLFALEGRSILGSLFGDAHMARDVPRLIALERQGRLDLEGLITRRIDLSDINDAMDALDRGDGVRSVIIYPEVSA